MRAAFLSLLLLAMGGPAASQAAEVDLVLVLAVDVSRSVNEERYALQRDGYARAFRDPAVIAAIHENGQRVAATLIEWSGAQQQAQVVPWMILTDRATSEHFAAALGEAERQFAGWTSISGGIDFAAALIRESGFKALRRVIDVSGDGSNNNGRSVTAARDEAVATGITINGLPILTIEGTLDVYYQENVIGGPGAFVIPTENFDTFARAIQSKLVKEIARSVPVEQEARTERAGDRP
jgi:hypothetical protein